MTTSSPASRVGDVGQVARRAGSRVARLGEAVEHVSHPPLEAVDEHDRSARGTRDHGRSRHDRLDAARARRRRDARDDRAGGHITATIRDSRSAVTKASGRPPGRAPAASRRAGSPVPPPVLRGTHAASDRHACHRYAGAGARGPRRSGRCQAPCRHAGGMTGTVLGVWCQAPISPLVPVIRRRRCLAP